VTVILEKSFGENRAKTQMNGRNSGNWKRTVGTDQDRKESVETEPNCKTIGETKQNHEQAVELSETPKTNGAN